MNKIKRRDFVKGTLLTIAAAPAAITAGNAALAHAQAAPTAPVSEDDPMAKALGYYHDATKVDLTKYPKRAGEEGAKQFCSNCLLLAPNSETTVAGHEGKWGKCTVITGGLVSLNGWCNSWVLKPGA